MMETGLTTEDMDLGLTASNKEMLMLSNTLEDGRTTEEMSVMPVAIDV